MKELDKDFCNGPCLCSKLQMDDSTTSLCHYPLSFYSCYRSLSWMSSNKGVLCSALPMPREVLLSIEWQNEL